MHTFKQRLRSHNLVGPNSILWRFLASKIGKVTCTTLFAVLIFILLWANPLARARIEQTTTWDAGRDGTVVGARPVSESDKGRLHLLVPATSSNTDLCKLLLSAQVLGYPVPHLINYGDAEDLEDAYKQHLAKVDGILKYLEQLDAASGEHAEELVLIVDGYDVWFQLPPDVLIKRYYEINRAADNRTKSLYGDGVFHDHNMRQTIVFGPDKLCWPVDYSRPACWAVPEVPLPRYAFGPETDGIHIEMFKPRWLNSGTIMGPAKDLKDLFSATLEAINRNHTTDSDQFYFANIFGEQSYARLRKAPGLLQQAKLGRIGVELIDLAEPITRNEPELLSDQRTEYHIGIDYTSSAFQTLAFYKQYLVFMRPADAWQPVTEQQDTIGDLRRRSAYNLEVPADIHLSRPPFYDLSSQDELFKEASISWSEVQLVYNVVTNQLPVMIHFTGAYEKQLREFWWQQLWLQTEARRLRLATQKTKTDSISPERINGLTWHNAEPSEAEDVAFGGRGGAWSDTGGWFSWSRLCKAHEGNIYAVTSDKFRHALPRSDGGGVQGQ